MQYFEQALVGVDELQSLRCTLREVLRSGEDTFKIILSNDLSKVEKSITPITYVQGIRFDILTFKLTFAAADEDLANGIVHFEPTGSYTWRVEDADTQRILQKGKAIVYPNGTFTTAHKFGDEVNYTEHSNPTTNTIYIQA